MKKFILFCVFSLSIGNFIFTQFFNPFLLKWNNVSEQFSLVRLDRHSGELTPICTIPGLNGVWSGSSAFDFQNNLYIFTADDMEGNTFLYSIDVNTGNIVSSPYFDFPDGFPNSLHVDQRNGNLYALYWDLNLSEEYLIRIDKTTGTFTKICYLPEVVGTNPDFTDFDSKNGVYIFLAFDHEAHTFLYTVDVNTGNVISKPSFEFADGYASEMHIDQNTGSLYALYWNQSLSQEFLIRIDRNTAAYMEVYHFPEVKVIQSGISAFDSQNGVYLFRGGDSDFNWSLYNFDLHTGNLLSKFPFESPDGDVLEMQLPQGKNTVSNALEAITICRNPTDGIAILKDVPPKSKIEVYSTYNEFIQVDITEQRENAILDLRGVKPGVYFIKVSNGKISKTLKLIKVI